MPLFSRRRPAPPPPPPPPPPSRFRNPFRRRPPTPVVVEQRPVTLKDKVSGALTKLRGSITGRPGVKAAGTRRMHGTDGRGMRRRQRRRFF